MAKDARSLPAAAQEDLRRKAVAAVRSGMSQVEAASVFGVTRQAVGRWVATSREKGTRALRAKRRGRPRQIQLFADEAAWVRRQIVNRTPDQLALKFFLWTREAVGGLIEAEFGIGLSVWTVGRYLKAWGFTPQKPIRRAFEQTPVAVQFNRSYLACPFPEPRVPTAAGKPERTLFPRSLCITHTLVKERASRLR